MIKPDRSGGRKRDTEQPKDRRAQIMKASARLFAEYGFEAASMRQIGSKVDMIAGSIYHHFPTKEDILHGILRGPMAALEKNATYIAGMPVDAELRLVASILRRFFDSLYDWEVYAIIHQDSQFLRRTEDFFYVSEVKQATFQAQEIILRDGVATGMFHEGIDIYLMIGTIARMLSAASAWFRRGDIFASDTPSRYSIDVVIDFHLENILRMVRASSRIDAPIPREFCERLADVDFDRDWRSVLAVSAA